MLRKTMELYTNPQSLDTYLAPMQEIIPFTEQELKRKVEQKETIKVYNKDNHECELSVTLCPTKRYIWLTTRMGQPTIKDAPGLEIIQTYNFKKVES